MKYCNKESNRGTKQTASKFEEHKKLKEGTPLCNTQNAPKLISLGGIAVKKKTQRITSDSGDSLK